MSKLYAANTQAPEVCLDADDSMKKELGGGTFIVHRTSPAVSGH